MATFNLAAAMRKVRALQQGESVAFVLVSPSDVVERLRDRAVSAGWPTRILVTRNMVEMDHTFRIELQSSDPNSQWVLYDDGKENEGYFTDHWFVRLPDVSTVLGFFAYEGAEQRERAIEWAEGLPATVPDAAGEPA